MTFITKWLWPIFAGFTVASVVMLLFEYVNSFIFPIPSDMDWNDPEAVRALTASLPWTAYILVLAGWAVGSFKGGWVATYFSEEKKFRAALVLAILLTLAGVWNVMLIGHDIVFTVIGLPLLFFGAYFGHRSASAKWPSFFFGASRTE